MSCALTTGFTLDCRDNIGGVKEIYIIEYNNIQTITLTDGIVTSILKKTGKVFYKYELTRETSEATETYQKNDIGIQYYSQEIQIVLNKRQVSVRNEIMKLVKNKLAVILVENNGTNWFYGFDNGMYLRVGNGASGTSWGDRNGYSLTLTGFEESLAPGVADSVIATLTDEGYLITDAGDAILTDDGLNIFV